MTTALLMEPRETREREAASTGWRQDAAATAGGTPALHTEPLSEAHEICAKAAEHLEETLAERAGLLTPCAAAVELLHEFKLIACALWPEDRSTQDDLVQEMALAALQVSDEHEPGFYCKLGAWRARDYLRWWLIPMYKRKNLDPKEIVDKIEGNFKKLIEAQQNMENSR